MPKAEGLQLNRKQFIYRTSPKPPSVAEELLKIFIALRACSVCSATPCLIGFWNKENFKLRPQEFVSDFLALTAQK
jgi:hypothetical protein